ncbi:eIF3 subunit 6 N terminal domain-containing protein [Rhodotorula toruloides]
MEPSPRARRYSRGPGGEDDRRAPPGPAGAPLQDEYDRLPPRPRRDEYDQDRRGGRHPYGDPDDRRGGGYADGPEQEGRVKRRRSISPGGPPRGPPRDDYYDRPPPPRDYRDGAYKKKRPFARLPLGYGAYPGYPAYADAYSAPPPPPRCDAPSVFPSRWKLADRLLACSRPTMEPPMNQPYLVDYRYFADWFSLTNPSAAESSNPSAALQEAWTKYEGDFLRREIKNHWLDIESKGGEWAKEKYGTGREREGERRERRRKAGKAERMRIWTARADNGELDDVSFDFDEEAARKPRIIPNAAAQAAAAEAAKKQASPEGEDSSAPVVPAPIQVIKASSPEHVILPARPETILCKGVPTSVTIKALEELFATFDGFVRLSISDPVPFAGFLRLAWITFSSADAAKQTLEMIQAAFKPAPTPETRAKSESAPVEAAGEATTKTDANGDAEIKDAAPTNGVESAPTAEGATRGKAENGADAPEANDNKPAEEPKPYAIGSYDLSAPGVLSIRMQPVEIRMRATPALCSSPDRLAKDVETALKAVEAAEKRNKRVLDLALSYLREAFDICFYCTAVCDSPEQLSDMCPQHVRRHDTVVAPSRLAAEAGWVAEFEKRVPLLTDTSALDLRDFGGDSREEELYRLTSPLVKQEEEGKFRCKTCNKLFSARKFVEKHIGLKHPEVVGDALDKLAIYNNYVLDPCRPPLASFQNQTYMPTILNPPPPPPPPAARRPLADRLGPAQKRQRRESKPPGPPAPPPKGAALDPRAQRGATAYADLCRVPFLLPARKASEMVATTSEPASALQLLPNVLPHLDRHLVLPLLDFLESREKYTHEETLKAKIDLLGDGKTNMVTFVEGLKRELEGKEEGQEVEGAAELRKREQKVLKTLNELRAQAQGVMEVISNPEVVSALRQDKQHNLTYLKENHGVTLDQIALLYKFGQFQYSIGHYGGASDYLYHFRVLSTDAQLVLSAMWGKLASDILEGSWDAALEELNGLREHIDQRGAAGPGGPLFALQQRTWWLHWSLFVYYNHPNGRELLLESWLAQNYLNTIQTAAPWLLRYLVAAVVISRKSTLRSAGPASAGNSARSREAVRDVVRALSQEQYQYRDPVTEFLRKLYGEVDFEGAREEMSRCDADELADDFFLEAFKDEFVENARYLVSEAYCKIHHRIDIAELSDRLGLSREEGERWIVDLVRDARLDAKIDLKQNIVQMNHADTPVYQTVIEKSRGLLFRSQALASAIEVRASGGQVDREQRLGGRMTGGQKRTGGQGGPRGQQKKAEQDGAAANGQQKADGAAPTEQSTPVDA